MTPSPNFPHHHPVHFDDRRLHWSVTSLYEDLGLEQLTGSGWLAAAVLEFDGPVCSKPTCRRRAGRHGHIRVEHSDFGESDALSIYPAAPADQVEEGTMHQPVLFPRRRRPLDVWESLVRVCVWTDSALVGLATSSVADRVFGLAWEDAPAARVWAQFEEVGRIRAENPGCLLVHVVRPNDPPRPDTTEEIVSGWLRASGEYVVRLPRDTSELSRLTAREQVRAERELVAAIRGMALKPSERLVLRGPDFVPFDERDMFPL